MKKSYLYFLILLLLSVILCGCSGKIIPVPETILPPVTEFSGIVTEAELLQLEQDNPALQFIDLTGSNCFAAIEAYIGRHPQVQVKYDIDLGGIRISPDVESLALEPNEFDYQVLRNNLMYLRYLEYLEFTNASLSGESAAELRMLYPDVTIDCGINFCGITCDSEAEDLDLSGISPDEVLQNASQLSLLTNLQEIRLIDENGKTAFTLEQAAELQKSVPNTLLIFSFELFDKRVNTTDDEIVYQGGNFGNQPGALDTLRMALSVLRGCKRFVLDNCKFSNEELAQVRDEFRDTTKVVWRIWFGEGGCLTDRKIIYFIYGLYDYNCTNLIYCEDAEFVDFGHNEYLKTCEFISGMKSLKAAILSGSMITDLTPFAQCKNLEFLELAYCGYITDISPLAACENLQRLNIAYTKVSDLSALDNLNLQVMVDAKSQTTPEEQARFDSLHTSCLIQHTGDAKDDQPYGYPWRYDENGDPNEYYAILIEKFNYPHPSNTRW